MKTMGWCVALALAGAMSAPAHDAHGAERARRRAAPAIGAPLRADLSPPLWAIRPPAPAPAAAREVPLRRPSRSRQLPAPPARSGWRDPLAALPAPGPRAPMPAPSLSIEGGSDVDNQAVTGGRVIPPDTNGDVGPNHYVQWTNLIFQIFDKSGATLLGPLAGKTLFAGFGGICETSNDGDPIVLYDQLADRWLMSQFATAQGVQCVAVSQTPDPTGAYYRYAFPVSPGGLNDYPKLGIWPTATNSAYLATFRVFSGNNYSGVLAVAFERDRMLAGDPAARFVSLPLVSPAGTFCARDGHPDCYDGALPAHLEGMTPPPDGSPGYVALAYDDESFSYRPVAGSDSYKLWRFHVDWTAPARSTLTGPVTIPMPEMDTYLCSGAWQCIPQRDVDDRLDHAAYFTMNRVVYRNFGSHESLWGNNTVNLGGDRAGIRWVEIRDPRGTPTVHQVGTHGPADGLHRWMGSLAVDKKGNMALGYNVSSPAMFPSIRYAGRLARDPLGTLPQTEVELHAGTGSQTGSFNRWGDYSSMSVDDADGCTFWFTTEYYQATGAFDYRTRIGSFRFPGCADPATGVVKGTVTAAAGGAPIVGVTIELGGHSTLSAADGGYSIEVPAGTYAVTASADGFVPGSVPGVAVGEGATVTRDFALTAQPLVQVSGTVTDGSGAGWPLYAQIVATPGSGPSRTVYSSPVTGRYVLTLPGNTSYSLTVTAQERGYLPDGRSVSLAATDQLESFVLLVNQATCTAPGYGFSLGAPLLAADFDAGIPAAWSVVSNGSVCVSGAPAVWNTSDVDAGGNATGGSGLFAEIDGNACGNGTSLDTDLITPEVDLSGLGPDQQVQVSFRSDYRNYCFPASGGTVTVSIWNGTSWVTLVDFCGQGDRRGPRLESFVTAAANGVAAARVRFHYKAGWSWWWQVDDVQVTPTTCQFRGGSVIVGHVRDANTGLPVDGAGIGVDGAPAAVFTSPTPADPALDDGYYRVTVSPGVHTLQASRPRYASAARDVAAAPAAVVAQDFLLAAGRIGATTPSLRRRLKPGGTAAVSVSLANSGDVAANARIVEIDKPLPGTAAPAPSVAPAPAEPRTAAVLMEFDTGLSYPWGLGLDTDAGALWVTNVKSGSVFADDKAHKFTTLGLATGTAIDLTGFGAGAWVADMTYNPRSKTLWAVLVGGDNCLHELDPAAGLPTPNRICTPLANLRGVAYDPGRDTYFVGGATGTFVAEIAPSGAVLRQRNVGLNVTGLALNARTGHLFVQVNAPVQLVSVLDVDANFAPTGAIALASRGGMAFDAGEGAGLEMDCRGRLWSANPSSKKVYVNESGEANACVSDIRWLSEAPVRLGLAPHASGSVAVQFGAGGMAPGCYEAQLMVDGDTPYAPITLPVGLTVQFRDVLPATKGDRYIHALAGASIAGGCASGMFCPAAPLSRASAAVWVLRSRFGPGYAPAPAGGIFPDVKPELAGAEFMEDAYNRGLIGACNAAGVPRFCPTRPVQRREMAMLLVKAQQGPAYTPPACTGTFTDVKCADPYAAWIEDAFRRGLAAACVTRPGSRMFCPVRAVSRGEMAEADARTFGIPACMQ